MTDGWIFKDQKGAKVFLDYLDELQAPYRVYWGDVDVKGWMSYKTPHKTTSYYKKGVAGRVGFDNLIDTGNDPFLMPDTIYKTFRRITDNEQ